MQTSKRELMLALANSLKSQLVQRSAPCMVSIYPHGTITNRGASVSLRTPPGRRRGAIKTFSRASAARLRRLLATTCGPDGWQCIGATLTVPGPEITAAEFRRVWRAFRLRLFRLKDIAFIWRVELQERGQPHLHLICWVKSYTGRIFGCFHTGWLECLGLLGPAEGPCKKKSSGYSVSDWGRCDWKPGWAKTDHRGLWPGALERAVRVKETIENNEWGWWRYLAAHASKAKQAQLGWQGRQWGVIGGQNLHKAPAEVLQMSRKAMDKIIRRLRRLTGCLYASGHGRQTWFDSPSASRRICQWAMSLTGEFKGEISNCGAFLKSSLCR